MIRLYNLERGDKIQAECFDGNGNKIGDTVVFDHVDGMYSFCTVEGAPDGENVVHLAATTPLEKVGDHYVISEEK